MAQQEKPNGLRRTLTLVGIVLGILVSAATVAGYLFQSRESAAEHEQVFTEHVGHFDTHVARSQARDELFIQVREELKEASAFRQALHTNQVRIMTKMRLQAVDPERTR